MSLIKSIMQQLGLSSDPTKNFTLGVPAVPDGTMKLARGNAGATTQDIMTVDAAGKVAFPQSPTTNYGPAFLVLRSGNQSAGASGTPVKVQLNSESFDTNNSFDSTTNYRFQPLVAGYYQISGSCFISGGTSQSYVIASLLKNGSEVLGGSTSGYQGDSISTVSGVIYLNGSTDYLELFASVAHAGGVPLIIGTQKNTFLSGALVRAA